MAAFSARKTAYTIIFVRVLNPVKFLYTQCVYKAFHYYFVFTFYRNLADQLKLKLDISPFKNLNDYRYTTTSKTSLILYHIPCFSTKRFVFCFLNWSILKRYIRWPNLHALHVFPPLLQFFILSFAIFFFSSKKSAAARQTLRKPDC